MTSAAAQARAVAAQVVQSIRDGRSLDEALSQALDGLDSGLSRERSLIQEMTYGTIRWMRPLQSELRHFLHQPVKPGDRVLESLLLVGLYQLRHLRVAPHAIVNETVEATVNLDRPWARNFVNAILRRAARESRPSDPSMTHPAWLLSEIQKHYPENMDDIVRANLSRPPMTLRVNLHRTTRDDLLAQLTDSRLPARSIPGLEAALVLESPVPVRDLPGFGDGRCSVQDAAAQLAAELLDAQSGMRVLDACAAPGGKTAHILERTPGAQLTAIDIDPVRIERIRENLTRLGLDATLQAGDAGHPERWWDGRKFDRILLDAPCSGTGVVRRHPDILVHRRLADIKRLVALQERLLDQLWPLLAPGGKLLYVTCSILPDENGLQAQAFSRRHPEAGIGRLAHPALERCAREPGVGWQILPGTCEMDGFYYAAWTRGASDA